MAVAPVVLAALLAQAAPALGGGSDADRALRLDRDADGAPVVVRADGTTARGVDVYRAVLRLDLVDAYERKATLRKAAWVFAAAALVAGPAFGYVVGKAQEQPTTNCFISVDGVLIPPCQPSATIAAENDRRVRRDVLSGTAIGAGLSAAFAVAALSIHPHAPSYDEARQLVDGWNARNAPPRSDADGALGPRLGLAPLAGGGAVSLSLRW